MSAPISVNDAQLLDVREVAIKLRCSARHIFRLADSGAMPGPVRIGALVRWRKSTGDPGTGLDDWIAAGCPTCRKAGRR